CEFGHHPAIGLVHGHLGVHRMGEQAPAGPVIEGQSGLVAGGFHAQHQHGGNCGTSGRIRPFSVNRSREKTACRPYASRKTSPSKWPCAASSAPLRRLASSPSCALASTTRSPPRKGSASSPPP